MTQSDQKQGPHPAGGVRAAFYRSPPGPAAIVTVERAAALTGPWDVGGGRVHPAGRVDGRAGGPATGPARASLATCLNLTWMGMGNMAFFDLLSGYKTYLAALGLVGLSVYQATQGQYDQAAQSFFGAMAAAGLHSAIVKSNA